MTAPSNPRVEFPEDFVFGGATAAYQCEGETRTHGKGEVFWDEYLETTGKFASSLASDFYNRYPVDLKLCEMLGINGIRVSIAWTRIFPEGRGEVNPEGVRFYHELFAECRRRGVEPFVTLHHFDTPNVFYKKGDFLNRETVDAFVEFATFCFAEFPEVRQWVTFNEIWAAAANLFVEGTWPWAEQDRVDKALQLNHNMMVAHARAVCAYKDAGFDGRIGVVHTLESKYPADPDDAGDIAAAKAEDVMQNQMLLDATFRGTYAPDTLAEIERLCALRGTSLVVDEADVPFMERAARENDFLGVNYYQSRFVAAYDGPTQLHFNGTGDKGTSCYRLEGVGQRVEPEGIDRTDWDWLIYPEGLFDLLCRIRRQWPNYKAIYITENGMGYKDPIEDGIVFDEPRIDYIKRHLQAVLDARAAGVNVCGYFVWSLMDMFSWNNGYNKRYGLFYVDFETQERFPKASAYWFKRVAESRRLDA